MFPRCLVIAGALDPGLTATLGAALLPATAVSFAAAWWLNRQSRLEPDGAPGGGGFADTNPLDLGQALRFGLLLAAIMLLARTAGALLGDQGVVMVAALSGLADVDAITLSMAEGLSDGVVGASLASLAILVAGAVNTFVKAGLVGIIATPRAGIEIALPLGAGIAAGGGGLWLLHAGYLSLN
jgi:uncharacterized membrane protein (DUF4010 family)